MVTYCFNSHYILCKVETVTLMENNYYLGYTCTYFRVKVKRDLVVFSLFIKIDAPTASNRKGLTRAFQ